MDFFKMSFFSLLDNTIYIKKGISQLLLLICTIFITCQSWAQTKISYDGPIYNIFFHPLIVYPELAFIRRSHHLNYMDNWFITVNEFKKILPQLYQRGFVLVSPKDLFEEKKDSQGRWIFTRKKLILSEGKKPLILSLDDYNFYKTMKSHGTVHRFLVDQKNKLVTVTEKNNASPIVKDNQEIPQLLEKFIVTHPDFSFNNARGIISLTGYNDIFGYNTHEYLSHESHVFEAKKVAKKLKEMGWTFASHSYFHLSEKNQTEAAFEKSEKRWQKEVGSIVGPTDYYIFPFGDDWHDNKARMKFLSALGYKYFFEVSQTNDLIIKPNAVVMQRFPIDGGALRGKYKSKNVYLNIHNILDPYRL